MSRFGRIALLAVAGGTVSQPALAQLSLPSMASALPNVSSMSTGNVAGVLQYCMSHKLVSTTSAETVLGGLKHKPNVASSPDYTAGAAGKILSGAHGKPMSLNNLPPHLKSQSCDMVLRQAKHLM